MTSYKYASDTRDGQARISALVAKSRPDSWDDAPIEDLHRWRQVLRPRDLERNPWLLARVRNMAIDGFYSRALPLELWAPELVPQAAPEPPKATFKRRYQ